jgi:hypothetical protein
MFSLIFIAAILITSLLLFLIFNFSITRAVFMCKTQNGAGKNMFNAKEVLLLVEHFFIDAAHRADKIPGQIFPLGARRNALVGIT